MKRTTLFVMIFALVSGLQAQDYLLNLRGKTPGQIANATNGTFMDSTFFISRIGTPTRDLTAAMLQRGYSADDFVSLAAAINQAESDTAMVIVSTNKSITATDTLHRTTALVVYRGGIINIASGQTFRIEGHFAAGRYKVFEGSGTVTFAEGSVNETFPEWWGAVPDSSTASLTSFNSIVTGAPSQARIALTDGVYLVSDSVFLSNSGSVTDGKSIRGNGTGRTVDASTSPDGTVIRNTNASGAHAMVMTSNGPEISDLSLTGNASSGIGLFVHRPSFSNTMGDYVLRNVYSANHGSDGFRIDNSDGQLMERIKSQWNGGYGINFDVPTTVTNAGHRGILPVLFTGRTRGNALGGIRMEQEHPIIMGFEAISDTVGGITIEGASIGGFRNNGTLLIGNDVEFAIPSRSAPATPVFNYKLQDTRNTVFLGGYAGSVHSKSSTTDVGTNTTTIVDSTLTVGVNDYYNGWKVVNDTQGSAEITVTDFVASTYTLTLQSAISGQTSGDSYTLKKYPNRGIWADSVYSSTFINTAWANQDSQIVVTDGSFFYGLFIGDQANLNPYSQIYTLGSGVAHWGEVALNQHVTGGKLYIRSSDVVSIQNKANSNVFLFENSGDGSTKEFRVYGDTDTTTADSNIQYIALKASPTVSNQFTFSTSTDSTRIATGAYLLMTGNDSTARFIEFQGEVTDPATPRTNYLRLFSRVDDDNLWIKKDNGDSSNIQKTQNLGDTLGVVLTAQGAATVARDGMNMVIDTFGAAASDTVVTLTGKIGDIVYISPRNSSRSLTFLDSGNFSLEAERTLDNVTDLLVLLARTTTTWVEVSFRDNQ